MKTAFLFPGQGAQAVGMGADVVQAFPAAAELFQKANDIVGFDLRKVCFEGPAERLNSTTMSQPAIFVTSAALLEVLRTSPATAGLKPDVTAGLSMGEYTALYAAGVMSFEDGLRLVKKRGEAMQAAANSVKGSMVSLIGLEEDKVRQLCDEASEGELLDPVNFNCPGQIVVSGTIGACERVERLAEKYGAVKAIRLEVAGAFHTPLMFRAAEALQEALWQCQDCAAGLRQDGGQYHRRVLCQCGGHHRRADPPACQPHPVAKVHGAAAGRRGRAILRDRPGTGPDRADETHQPQDEGDQRQRPELPESLARRGVGRGVIWR